MTVVSRQARVSRGWLSRVLLVLAVAALAAAASPARSQAAPVTIGNSLANAQGGSYFGCGVPCTTFQSTQPGATLTSPVDGAITSWSYRSQDAGASYALRVVRPVGGSYLGAGSSANVTVPDSSDTVKGPIATNVSVRAGDRIGLDVTISPNTGAPIFTSTSASDVLGYFTAPDLANGGSARTPSSAQATSSCSSRPRSSNPRCPAHPFPRAATAGSR